MNLKQLIAEFTKKQVELDALLQKDAMTDEELKAATDLTNELKGLKEKIDSRKQLEQDAEAFRQLSTTPAAGGPDLGTRKAHEHTGEATFKRGEKVGTDLVQITLFGNQKIDHEGFELTEKQFTLMQEDSYLKSWRNYLRKGEQGLGKTDYDVLNEVKSLSGGNDTGVGFFVPPQVIMELIKRDPQEPGVLDLVRSFPCSSDKLLFPRMGYTGQTGDTNGDIYSNPLRISRTGEGEAAGTLSDPNIGTVEITMHEGSMELPMTRTLLQDAAIPVDSWVAEMMRESFDLETSRELINGVGMNGPAGILGSGVGGTGQIPTVNIGNAVTADGLIDLFYNLPKPYRKNGTALMNDTNLYRTLAKLKDTAGNYIFGLFKNTDGGMATPRGEVFLGKPIAFDPFMPDGGAAANAIVWGDFRKLYYYGLRMGMTLEMQMLPRDAFAYAVFRFRNGGKTVQPRAARVGVQS